MYRLADLALGDPLARSARTVLRRATGPDGVRLLVRLPVIPGDEPTRAELDNERAVTHGLAGPQGPLLLPLPSNGGGTPFLIYADDGLEPLSVQTGRRADLGEALELAVAIAETVEQLHARGLVHLRLQPGSVLVEPESGRVRLTDLGLASPLGPASISALDPSAVPLDLAWISPEQTGRVDRGIDQRSDLYSLGVLLYQLLAGRLPLEATSVSQWVHRHIALRPPRLSEAAPGRPAALSQVLERLLEKSPDDRYQTASGLVADLRRCRDDWRTRGAIGSFTPGRLDGSGRLHRPEHLHGRDRQAALLRGRLARIGEQPGVVLVSGPPGSGKTFLVERVLQTQAALSFRILRGKGDQSRRGLPYDVLLQAFEALASKLIAAPDSESRELVRRLRAAAGPSGGALLQLMPGLSRLIGAPRSAPDLPPGLARNRLHLSCKRLVQACARPARPLLLFLDDLQWVDRATLELLEELLRSSESGAMLIVGALRVEQAPPHLVETVTRLEAAGDTTSHLRLEGLGPDDVQGLVAETLAADPEAIGPLAAEVARKTAGNPYYVGEFLAASLRAAHLRYDPIGATWTWDADRIRSVVLRDGVVGLVKGRLEGLSEDARGALAHAACIGGHFSVDLLADCLTLGTDELEALLAPSLEAGLVIPRGDDLETLSFAHDRIQEAAATWLDETGQARAHLTVGRALARRHRAGQGDELLFQTVSHLNRADPQLLEQNERRWLARLDLEAARRALTIASAQTACEVTRSGLALLPPDSWDSDYDLTLDLHVVGASAAYLARETEQADRLAAVALENARSPLDRSRVQRLRVHLLLNQLALPEALTEGLELLRALGHPVDEASLSDALPERLATLGEARDGRTFDQLEVMEEMTDPAARAALQILCDIIPASTMARPELAPTLTIKAIELVLTRGLCPQAATACSTWGLLLCTLGMHDEGYGFGELGVRLMQRYSNDATASMVAVQFPVFIQHHREPLRATIRRLHEGAVRCLELGALDNYGYCENQGWIHALFAGEALDGLDATYAERHDRLIEFHQTLSAAALGCFGQVVANLRAPYDRRGSWELSGERFDLDTQVEAMGDGGFLMGVFFAHLAQLWLAVLFEESDVALLHLRAARPVADTCRSMFALPVYDFYAALALVAAMEQPDADREALAEELTGHRDRLTAAAAVSPDNHGFRLLLVDAELARVDGRQADALPDLDRMIRAAGRGGFVLEAALGHERTASLHRAAGRPSAARAHLLAARCIHQTWGARAKVEQLEAQLALLDDGGLPFDPAPTGDASGSVDLDTVLRVAEVISGQMDLDRLVSRLLRFAMENAGASRGLLFLTADEGLSPVARGWTGPSGIEIVAGRDSEPDEAATRVLDYVLRTRTTLVLDDARRAWPFPDQENPGGRIPRSLLALPLESRGDLTGVLYLENDLVGGAFTRPRMDLLRVVASLAATMLENARLLATLSTTTDALQRSNVLLERYTSDLEGRVDQRTAELAGLYREHRMILESIEEGILRLDDEGRITFSNPAAERLTGRSSAELDGRSHHLLLQDTEPGAGRRSDCPLCRASGPSPGGAPIVPLELLLRRREGEPLPVELAARPIHGPDGERAGTVVTFRDISRRRQLQTQLEHAQRLETLGRFVGAVAHDFNNLLTPLMGGAAQLLDENDLAPESRNLLENMERASRRASELVQQMLAFGRRTKIFMQPTDLGSVIDEIAGFFRHALSRGIGLEVERPGGLSWTWGDRVQIHQVLLNLCVNAQDALETGGASDGQPLIRLRAGELRVQADRIPHDSTAEPGRFIELEVSDNGPGMEQDTARRMFEPFYTTKEAGKGTGLGLSVVYGIVRSHRGWVTCDTAPGQGATFRVYLPARTPATGEWDLVSADRVPAPTDRTAHILVVDDEVMIRDLVATALRRRGHTVLQAGSGPEALALHREHGHEIDLILLDLVMPEMPGEDVLARLLEVDPDVRVCLVSGYAEGSTAESVRDLGAVGFLAKPFTVRQLANLVQAALERR